MSTTGKQTPLDEFASTLEQLADVVQDIIKTEEIKALAASQSQHKMLDELLKDEQVLILKLRGLEQRRLKQAEALGWKGLTFRNILEQATDGQKVKLNPLFTELSEKIKLLTDAKDTSERIIKIRLREFGNILNRDGQQSYDGQGPAGEMPFHFQDKYV